MARPPKTGTTNPVTPVVEARVEVIGKKTAKIDPVAVIKEAFGEHLTKVIQHPLFQPLSAAVLQATDGKGERHGGDATPFFDQPWAHIAGAHGVGFLTGQAAKKLGEAASNYEPGSEAYIRELQGAIVYIGMAILFVEADTQTGDDDKGV